MKKRSVAIMISGQGSNMSALIQATFDKNFPAQIIAVISDKAQAKGIDRARTLGVPTFICERDNFSSQEEHETALLTILENLNPDLICLAGYMRLMSTKMVETWAGRMLNIHPSLLPLFPGLNTHRRALEAGVKVAGCTVHIVTPQMDSGPILAQAVVPVLEKDDENSLAKRVLQAEHQIYSQALRQFILQNRKNGKDSGNDEAVLFSYG